MWSIWNDAWVTRNNDVWSQVRWFANDFHKWRKSRVKIMANYFTTDQKITVTNALFHFSHAILCPELTKSIKNSNPLLISPLLPRTAFSHLALWCHNSWSVTSLKCSTGIVTSHPSILLARANWCNGDLHWWITTVNIDSHHPVSMA